MSAERATDFDPITFEMIRQKLAAITEEQAITLKAMSGSPIVTHASDFNSGLYGANGEIVTMGWQVLFHSGGMASVIRHVIEDCHENPGIGPGDVFLLNDPYRGGLHQSEFSLVAPIHFERELVAWTGVCAHQLDVGGMSFGSFANGATEIQQESMLLPGIKLVEGGRMREDLWRMIMGMTRLPGLVGLDVKAMIAANSVARDRFCELLDRYGAKTVMGVMAAEIDASEQRFRARLRELPEGIYRANDFLEHDGHKNRLYKIALALHKRDDTLAVDMEGSSDQAPGFINCTMSGLKGAFLAGMMPIMAPDIRWNEGILKAVTFRAPEGSVVNSAWPAPVSCATTSAMFCVLGATQAACSRLVALSAQLSGEAGAVSTGPSLFPFASGRGRDGKPWGALLIDGISGGGGAYEDHDGLGPAADFCIPRPSIPNVESVEADGPYVYLYRSLLADSGGAGCFRGGVGMSMGITPHETDGLDVNVIGTGFDVPNSAGLFGGLEGSGSAGRLLRGSSSPVGVIASRCELVAAVDVRRLEPKGHVHVKEGDVISFDYVGGGGHGDPLNREPRSVKRDVDEALVSDDVARTIYGVVRDAEGRIEEQQTNALRRALRVERLKPGSDNELALVRDHNGTIQGTADRRLLCSCGLELASPGGNWKHRALTRVVAARAHGPLHALRSELEVREHVCPRCGTLLESEIARIEDPGLHTVELM